MASDMASTRVLTRIVGPYLAVIGAALALNGQGMLDVVQRFEADVALVFFLGVFLLLVGISMAVFHTRWTSPVAAVLSAIAWITILRGALLTAAPGFVVRIASGVLTTSAPILIGGGVSLLIGLWLSYEGYFRKAAL